jgi:uncharacterized protein YkwD
MRIHLLSISIALVTFSILFSCQEEPKEESQVTKKEVVKKSSPNAETKKIEEPMVKKSTNPSSSTAGSKSKIDYKNVNLTLLENLIHEEINKARKANGASQLINDFTLRKAAVDQNNYCVRNTDLSHTQSSPGKRTIKDRVQYYGKGYSMMAENLIYEGFTVRRTNGKISDIIAPTYRELAKTMVVNWMKSPGHRQNIVEKELKRVGTAVAYNPSNYAVYATQVFGTKLSD